MGVKEWVSLDCWRWFCLNALRKNSNLLTPHFWGVMTPSLSCSLWVLVFLFCLYLVSSHSIICFLTGVVGIYSFIKDIVCFYPSLVCFCLVLEWFPRVGKAKRHFILILKMRSLRNSLVVQWLGCCASTVGGDTDSIPGQGTKTLQPIQHGQKKKFFFNKTKLGSLKEKNKFKTTSYWLLTMCKALH